MGKWPEECSPVESYTVPLHSVTWHDHFASQNTEVQQSSSDIRLSEGSEKSLIANTSERERGMNKHVRWTSGYDPDMDGHLDANLI